MILFNILVRKYFIAEKILYARDVNQEDANRVFRCETRHRLSNEIRISNNMGRLYVTGKFNVVNKLSINFNKILTCIINQ